MKTIFTFLLALVMTFSFFVKAHAEQYESFVGKFPKAKAYMLPDAGKYEGYTEVKYKDGTFAYFSFDVSNITEDDMNKYTMKLEENKFKLVKGENFTGTGKRYRYNAEEYGEAEDITIIIGYIKRDDKYRVTVK